MKEISIRPRAQVIGLAVMMAAVVAALVSQAPEIKRYMKVRKM